MARLATHVLSYSENYNKSKDNHNSNGKNKKKSSNNSSNNKSSDNSCNTYSDRNSSSMYMGGLSKPIVAAQMYTAPRPLRLSKKKDQ